MSIPEIDKAIVKFLDFVDEPIVLSVFKNDRQACYEAGKRDAVPAWPPRKESVFIFEGGKTQFKFDKCWLASYSEGSWVVFGDGSANALAIEYFTGELKEVGK